MKAPSLCCGFLLLIPFILKSQSRCGAAEYERQGGSPEKKFEQWMKQKKKENNSKKNNSQSLLTQGTSVIPVVVHVIHNGENEGEGSNISDEQIISQIDVLNADYRRMNADRINTPDEFAGVAGSFDIEFVLAKRTPDNRHTTGIVRVNGTQQSWSLSESPRLKALSYWPAEKYLNIWVTALEAPYVGYAQFPDYNLPGIGSDLNGNIDGISAKNRETDGVVIHYSVMGSNGGNLGRPKFELKEKYNLGRTATHEIGHYFGLRHLGGDKDDCTGTDYVNDTPPQDTNYNSQSPVGQQFSCGVSNMYQNYLNYTDDKAMNLFTKDQVERMSIVLNNSPRRKDLLESLGDEDPPPDAPQYDIQLTDAGPITVTCNPTYTPTLSIRNNGTVDLYEVQVKATINRIVSIIDVNVPLVPKGKSVKIKLNSYRLNDGKNTVSINVMPPDDQEDSIPSDNTFSYSVILNKSEDAIPLRENFEASSAWLSIGYDNFNWNIVKTETNAAKASLFGSSSQKGFLVSPVLDFSKLQKASIFFDVSYGYKASSFPDTLKLLASKDCGASYEPVPLYMKTAEKLSTTVSETAWLPTIRSDWRREFISLAGLTDKSNLRFAFVSSGNGNNIFIDNIEFYDDDNPAPINVASGYSVYGLPNDYRITLNLDKRQDIIVQLFTVTGDQVMQKEIPNALNQTFFLNTNDVPPGVYVFRILGNEAAATRILVK